MKHIFLTITIVFLCYFSTFAQKTISKEDFEKLIDYANCNYIMTYIEKNDSGKPYFTDTDFKKLKSDFYKVSLKDFKTIPDYNDIKKLLANNNQALDLAETINKRKEEYNSIHSDELLIQKLKATVWAKTDLVPTADSVLKSVYEKFRIEDKISAQEIEQTQTNTTSTQGEQLQTIVKEEQYQDEMLNAESHILDYQKSLYVFKLIVMSAFILLILLLGIIFFLFRRNLSEYIIKQVLESNRINERFTPKEVNSYTLTENDLNIITNKVSDKMQLLVKENQPPTQPIIEVPNETAMPVAKYLKGKSGKIFNRVENTPENSFFKILNGNEEIAQFEFCGNEVEAIAKRIFSEDICVIASGNYHNARTVTTSKPGKIKRIGDQWEVIEPIHINLI